METSIFVDAGRYLLMTVSNKENSTQHHSDTTKSHSNSKKKKKISSQRQQSHSLTLRIYSYEAGGTGVPRHPHMLGGGLSLIKNNCKQNVLYSALGTINIS